MTSIRGRVRLCRERTSKGSSPPPEFIHDETPVNPPAIEPPIAKYTKEDLQKILRTVFEAWAPSDSIREKPLKAKSPDVYCGNSHMECYNFCLQCENHFAIAGAKSPNRIFFATFFLYDRINFSW